MKPRNAREREVLALSEGLTSLTKAQYGWVREKVVNRWIFTRGLTCWCTECGHSWKERLTAGERATCPHCGKEAEVVKSGRTTYGGFNYARFIQVHKGWQVVRYVIVHWSCRKGDEIHVREYDVFQKWCQPGRAPVTVGIPLGMMGGYCTIPYSSWGGPMSIKSADHHSYYYEWMEVKAYPRTTLLPVYKRVVGAKPDFSVFTADVLLGDIFGCPYFERLLKAKQTAKLNALLRYAEDFHKYWPSVKVAARHGYEPEYWGDYFDYLKMLRFLGFDMRSPRYVAPPDWQEIHTKVVALCTKRREKAQRTRDAKEALRRAQEAEERERRAKSGKRSFSRRIAKFAALCITNGDITIKPLMTIGEFAEEGMAMGHCVFSNTYYSKKTSLILSARRTDGERVETVEVDLKGLTILQSRGRFNGITEHHDEIVNMVTDAMPWIDSLAHPRRKKAVTAGRS